MGCGCNGGGASAAGGGSSIPRLSWTVTMPSGARFADGASGSKTFISIGDAQTEIAKAGQSGKVTPRVSAS